MNKKAKQIYAEKGHIIDVANELLVLPAPTFLITPAHIAECKRHYSGESECKVLRFAKMNHFVIAQEPIWKTAPFDMRIWKNVAALHTF